MDAFHGEFGYRQHSMTSFKERDLSISQSATSPWSSNTVLICADLIFEQISEWRLLTEFAWEQNRIALEAAYLRPRFDADSIWVAFAPAPHHSASVHASKFMGKFNWVHGSMERFPN